MTSVAVIGLLLALAGCGGDSEQASSSPGPGQRAGGRRAFAQDPAVRACLAKQGITLPGRGAGGGPPPAGRGRPQSARLAKLRAALATCGVQGRRGPGGPPGNGAPTQTAPSATTN